MGARFQVGEQVQVPFGRGVTTGVVVEDRGGIGVGGRRLYRVEVPMDPYKPASLELPESDLEPFDPANVHRPALDKPRIRQYLTHGGLIAILRRNLAGGRSRRVWLCLDSLDNVTFTFHETRGIVGGAWIPVGAVHGDKVYTPKRDEVRAYLQSFGLDGDDADAILEAVGTAPRLGRRVRKEPAS